MLVLHAYECQYCNHRAYAWLASCQVFLMICFFCFGSRPSSGTRAACRGEGDKALHCWGCIWCHRWGTYFSTSHCIQDLLTWQTQGLHDTALWYTAWHAEIEEFDRVRGGRHLTDSLSPTEIGL